MLNLPGQMALAWYSSCQRKNNLPTPYRRDAMKGQFLLIGDSTPDNWLAEVLGESIDKISHENILEGFDLEKYQAIILDAALLQDVGNLLQKIRLKNPDTRILVTTNSPTWRRARESFWYGATDYIQTSNREEIVARLHKIHQEISLMGGFVKGENFK